MIALPTSTVDLEHHRVLRPDGEVSLTQLEVDALRYLAARPGQVVARAELEREVWRMARGARSEAVPVAMRRLRQKVGSEALSSVRGEGWRLVRVTPPPPPLRLPAFTTPFVGREAMLDELERRLTGPWRLVSLRGPAGVGKTRLAMELARRWKGEIIAISGAGLRAEPDALLLALAEALGLMEAEPRVIARAMSARPTPLVLLDDADGLVGQAGPTLVHLLAEAPEARALVTGRVALQVPGEAALEVPPFPQDLAAQFFAERWAGARLEQAHDREASTELARLLDGLPGGLELYAGRAELGLDALLDELRAGQQASNLDEQVARSWRDLDASARRALLACSACPCALTAEEARIAAGVAADRLPELRRRSLLQLDAQGRLFMLATVRRFCARQPGRHEAGAAARQALLQRAEALVEALASRPVASLRGLRELLPALLELASEAAPAEAARAALAADALLAITGPAARRTRLLEGVRWSALPAPLAARGRVAVARARRETGAPTAAVLQALGDVASADACLLRGELAVAAGEAEAARAHFEAAITRSGPVDGAGLLARARRCATASHQRELGPDRIDAELAGSIQRCELEDRPLYLPELLRSAALVAKARGAPATARQHLSRALQLAEAQGQIRMVGDLWATLGMIWFDERLPQAEACFERALAHATAYGDSTYIHLFQVSLGSTLQLQDRPAEALARLDEAASHLRGRVARQACHFGRALALFALGRPLDAEIALDSVEAAALGGMYSPNAEAHGQLLLALARAEPTLARLGQDPEAAPALRALLASASEEASRDSAVALRALVRRVERKLAATGAHMPGQIQMAPRLVALDEPLP